MKKTLKTKEILKAWTILGAAKYGKISDEDRIRVWKISRALQPIATRHDEDRKDAIEKLKPEGFNEKAVRWNETREKKIIGISDDLPMDDREFVEFTHRVINPYNQTVDKAIREFEEKKVTLTFDGLSEDAFGKLMAYNEWTLEQAAEVSNLIVEQKT